MTLTPTPEAVGIIGAGHALPPTVLTTADLQRRVEEASGFRMPEGILEKVTGIRERRVVTDGELPSTLAAEAGKAALARAEREPEEVDLLLFASASRDFIEPATSHVTQHLLGTGGMCLDVTNACNSFVNGIDLARAMILTGRARTALVVTGETPSLSMRPRVASMRDAVTHFAGYTFGDAGAAVVLEGVERGGILHTENETHSEHWAVGGIFGGGSKHPRDPDKTYFTGAGTELRVVFEKIGPAIVESTLRRLELTMADMSRVLVHQVTWPYVERFCEVTGAPLDRLDVTVRDHGNIASATLGLQLSRAWESLVPGERVLMVGLGGGVSVQTMVWEVT